MTIQVSAKAKQIALDNLKQRGSGIGLRLGVKPSGCSSFSYVLEFVDQQNIDDLIFNFDELTLLVDKKSLVYLKGMTLDYERDGLNEGFVFKNPNAKDFCGCGESFNV